MNNKIFLIANWKMSLNQEETEKLVMSLKKEFSGVKDNVQIIIAPTFIYLEFAKKILEGSSIKLAAQDTFWTEKGAFTGEVSPLQLKEIGAEYVICGHSERKRHLAETDEMIGRKIQALLKQKMCPVVCVGEDFEDRQAGRKNMVVANQLKKYFQNISLSDQDFIIIAYEPVWAIGSGQACEPSEAKETAYLIKQNLMEIFSPEIVSGHFTFIYGGSVRESNINDYINQDILRGALIGGASTHFDSFSKIIKSVLSHNK